MIEHSPGGNGANPAKALFITVLLSLLGLLSMRWVGTSHNGLGSELRLLRRQCRLLSMEGRLHAPIRRPSEVSVMQLPILPYQRSSEERECHLSKWTRTMLLIPNCFMDESRSRNPDSVLERWSQTATGEQGKEKSLSSLPQSSPGLFIMPKAFLVQTPPKSPCCSQNRPGLF